MTIPVSWITATFKTFILLLISRISLQCSTPSFDNTLVLVNGEKKWINGCISPATLQFKGQISEIRAINQNIPDLNRGAVRDILDLFDINFRKNNIEIIRKKSFLNLPNLRTIDLSDNEINWISKSSFTNLSALSEVNLAFNPLRVSLRSFNNLKNLSSVDFGSCQLTSFDQGWFYKTPRLSMLSFDDNHLRKIPADAFINLPSLTILDFDNNEIEEIDKDAFEGLKNLRLISMEHNRLKRFEISFQTRSRINFLRIRFNNITYVSDTMLETMKLRLDKIWITGNPLQCACLNKLVDWGSKNKVQIEYTCRGQETICVIPKSKQTLCINRTDDDFQYEFWKNFENDKLCA